MKTNICNLSRDGLNGGERSYCKLVFEKQNPKEHSELTCFAGEILENALQGIDGFFLPHIFPRLEQGTFPKPGLSRLLPQIPTIPPPPQNAKRRLHVGVVQG